MTRLFQLIKIAFKGIFTNKVRSLLTVLGIVIGIAAVIGLMGIGTGAQEDIESGISSLGTDIVSLYPGDIFGGGPQDFGGMAVEEAALGEEDFAFLADEDTFPEIDAISPMIQGAKAVRHERDEYTSNITGVNEQYGALQKLTVEFGRFFSQSDLNNNRFVVVVGPDVLNELSMDPIESVGKNIFIDNKKFEIVGVLEEQGQTGFSNPDANIYIPYTTGGTYIFETEEFGSIQFTVTDTERINRILDDVTEELAHFRDVDVDEPDFSFFTSEQLIATVQDVTSIFTALLAGIAAISLVVGGIGISNIMLVSVTERTREIGLRKAVGAEPLDILFQFLFEAIILTLVGGVLGIVFGVVLGAVVGNLTGVSSAVTVQSIGLATGVSVAIGIVFGFAPAYKASRLDPIDALRYE